MMVMNVVREMDEGRVMNVVRLIDVIRVMYM